MPSPTSQVLSLADFEAWRDTTDLEDDGPVLDALFAFHAANPLPGRVIDIANDDNPVFSRSPLHIRADQAVVHLPPRFEFDLVAVEGYAIRIDAERAEFYGCLRVELPDMVPVGSRMVDDIVQLGGCWRTTFTGFALRGANITGICVLPTGNVIDASLGDVEVNQCGSIGTGHALLGQSTTFVDRVDHTNNVIDQQTELLIPPGVSGVVQPGDLAIVQSASGATSFHLIVDEVVTGGATDSVYVYPKVDPTEEDHGTVYFIGGAAVHLQGNNSSGLTIDRLTAMHVGSALKLGSLYGCHIGSLTAEGCGCGIQIGELPNEVVVGGSVSRTHLEANQVDVMKVSRSYCPITLGVGATFNLAKWRGLEPVNTSGEPVRAGFGRYTGIEADRYGPWNDAHLQGPRNVVTRTILSNSTDHERAREGVVLGGFPSISLEWSEDANRVWGLDTCFVDLPTAAVGGDVLVSNMNWADGITIAGLDDPAVEVTLPGPCRVVFVYQHADKNWLVRVIPMSSPTVVAAS